MVLYSFLYFHTLFVLLVMKIVKGNLTKYNIAVTPCDLFQLLKCDFPNFFPIYVLLAQF